MLCSHVAICLIIHESGTCGCTESKTLLSHREADRKFCRRVWRLEYIKRKKKHLIGQECLPPNKKSTAERIQRGNFTPSYEQIRGSPQRRSDAMLGNSSAARLTEGVLILDRPAKNKG